MKINQYKETIILAILKEANIKPLTRVQQEILDACEPLIKNLQDRAIKWMDSVIKKFDEQKNNETKDIDRYKYIRNYSSNDDSVYSLLSSVYSTKSDLTYIEQQKLKNYSIDEKRKKAYYEREKENIRIYNIAKLSDALIRYITPDFIKVKNIRLSQGSKGFEITANLIDKQNRQWDFRTIAIGAGGYNIQIWHYRYLINLSSPEVPSGIVRQRITQQEKIEREIKQQERLKEREEKNKLVKAKTLTSLFYAVRSKIKDWDVWLKSMLLDQISRGTRKQTDFDEEQKNIERLVKFNDKYNFKRQELNDKILKGEISFSVFDEIKDIINDLYEYKKVERMS
jgi:hypothetical protein